MTRLRPTRDIFSWTLRKNYYEDQGLEICYEKKLLKDLQQVHLFNYLG